MDGKHEAEAVPITKDQEVYTHRCAYSEAGTRQAVTQNLSMFTGHSTEGRLAVLHRRSRNGTVSGWKPSEGGSLIVC